MRTAAAVSDAKTGVAAETIVLAEAKVRGGDDNVNLCCVCSGFFFT